MDKIPFEDGTLVKAGYVEIDGTKHETVQPEYTGNTPLSAYNLNKMQDNIESDINAKAEEQNTLREDGDLVRKIKISGASKQETREGYNKLNVLNINTTTINGITFTSLGDGTIKANGTATANATFKFTEADGSGDRVTRLEEGTYTLYCKNSDYSKAFLQMGIKHDNGTEEWHNASSLKTIETAGANYSALIYVRSGVTLDNVVFKPMLLKGTYTVDTIPEFEQYGASPSIEYEAPVESAGDNINEYNANATFPINSNGLTITKEDDGSVTINGTATANVSCVIGTVPLATIEKMNKKEYTLSLEESGIGSVSNTGLKHNGNDRFVVTSKSPIKSGTFNKVDTDTKDYSWALWIISGTVFTNYNLKLKLSKGTSTGAHSPYGQGSIEIKQVNENLYDGKNETGGINADGSLATATDRWRTTNFIDIRNYKEIKIKCFNITTTDNLGRYYLYDENHNILSNSTFTIKSVIDVSNASYIKFWCLNAQVPNTTQIQVGTNITDYVPHQSQTKALYTQQPFRSVKDVEDTFAKKMGKWHEEHPIFRKIFDGTENWLYQDRGNGIYRFNILLDNAINLSGRNQVLSNYFLYKGSSEEEGNCFISQRYVYFYSSISSINDFKSKLTELYNAGTPVYVDYVLATPTLIECTPEQVEVLNDIYSAYGEGMTNIICNDEVEPVIEIVKETKETVQSENDKAISALLARVTELEELVASLQNTAVEEGA